jgi:hypothetical protein
MGDKNQDNQCSPEKGRISAGLGKNGEVVWVWGPRTEEYRREVTCVGPMHAVQDKRAEAAEGSQDRWVDM